MSHKIPASTDLTKLLVTSPTPDELLRKATEEVHYHFTHLKDRVDSSLANIHERLTNPDRHISNEISWVASDLLLAEVRRETLRWYEGMISSEADRQRTPWEATIYIYKDLQSRLIEQSSYYGMELHSCSTEPVANAMAHHRVKAISHVLRYDLGFVKYYGKKLELNLFHDSE